MRESNRITVKELEFLVYRTHDGSVGLSMHSTCDIILKITRLSNEIA